MEVWLAEWDYPEDMEHNVEVWSNEQEALQDVCNDIQNSIDEWDLNDPDFGDKEAAERFIENFQYEVSKNNWRAAMEAWNDYESDFNPDFGEWYSVTKKQVGGGNVAIIGQQTPAVAYKATVAGATCRGPCKQYNEYAYADRPDGTHVCHQCGTFQSIFGVKP